MPTPIETLPPSAQLLISAEGLLLAAAVAPWVLPLNTESDSKRCDGRPARFSGEYGHITFGDASLAETGEATVDAKVVMLPRCGLLPKRPRGGLATTFTRQLS